MQANNKTALIGKQTESKIQTDKAGLSIPFYEGIAHYTLQARCALCEALSTTRKSI